MGHNEFTHREASIDRGLYPLTLLLMTQTRSFLVFLFRRQEGISSAVWNVDQGTDRGQLLGDLCWPCISWYCPRIMRTQTTGPISPRQLPEPQGRLIKEAQWPIKIKDKNPEKGHTWAFWRGLCHDRPWTCDSQGVLSNSMTRQWPPPPTSFWKRSPSHCGSTHVYDLWPQSFSVKCHKGDWGRWKLRFIGNKLIKLILLWKQKANNNHHKNL